MLLVLTHNTGWGDWGPYDGGALRGAPSPSIDRLSSEGMRLLNKEKSGRDGLVVFVADDLRAVKWHDWKVHFAWAPTKYSPVERYSTVLKVVDLTRDPREERQVAEPFNGWLQFKALPLLGHMQATMKTYPNIPVGTPKDFVPSYPPTKQAVPRILCCDAPEAM